MKVRVVANELVDTDIEMVSLVRHGANRCPFKVLKSEDDEADKASLSDKLQSFFSLGRDDLNVTAYFIRKDATDALLPVLKAEGVDVSKTSELDGVTVVTVSEAAPRGFVQLNAALAIAVDQPIREFSDESVVKAYAEAVGLSGFAPGVSLAVHGLADTVWSLLNSNDAEGSREDRVAKVDTMLASFRKYITSLAKVLPERVFRVEAATRDLIKTEDLTMPQGKPLSEVVPGDLDGLEKAEATPDDEELEKGCKAKKKAVGKDEETPPEGDVPANADPAAAEAAPVTADSAVLKALEAISAQVADIAKKVDDQRSITDNLAAQMAEVEDLAKTATEAAESTTLLRKGEDVDLTLSSLGGTIRRQRESVAKTGEALWDGLLPDLDTFRSTR